MTGSPVGERRTAIIGAGRVGCAVGRALIDAGTPVVGATSRSEAGRQRAQGILGIPIDEDVVLAARDAELVIVATPDRAIANVALELAVGLPASPPRWFVHMSGCTGLDALAPLARQGHRVCSMHPVQTVTVDASPNVLDGCVAAVTAGPGERNVVRGLATLLGMHPIDLDDEAKALHHAACSIAANYTVVLMGAVRDLARASGADADALLDAYAALGHTAADRAASVGPERALTGPIARGDLDTVALHRDAIDQHAPQHRDLYDTLARSTERLTEAAHALH